MYHDQHEQQHGNKFIQNTLIDSVYLITCRKFSPYMHVCDYFEFLQGLGPDVYQPTMHNTLYLLIFLEHCTDFGITELYYDFRLVYAIATILNVCLLIDGHINL